MNRLPMSRAASGLLRALLARAGGDRDRILLTNSRSVEWQSLTFTGERHEFGFRLTGPDAHGLLERFTGGVSDADLPLAGNIVADIAAWSRPTTHPDGSISVEVEALTIDGQD